MLTQSLLRVKAGFGGCYAHLVQTVMCIWGWPIRVSRFLLLSSQFTLCAGINKGHVEAMESRLKQDVLKEAEEYGNQVSLFGGEGSCGNLPKREARDARGC